MRVAGRYSLLSALFVLGLGASAFAQAAKADPVRAAIEKQNAAFSAAFARGDVAAVAAAYTEDAIAFPPDADMVRGRAAIQALWQSLRDAGAKSVVLTTVDVHLERHALAREMRARSGGLTSATRRMNVWSSQGSCRWAVPGLEPHGGRPGKESCP